MSILRTGISRSCEGTCEATRRCPNRRIVQSRQPSHRATAQRTTAFSLDTAGTFPLPLAPLALLMVSHSMDFSTPSLTVRSHLCTPGSLPKRRKRMARQALSHVDPLFIPGRLIPVQFFVPWARAGECRPEASDPEIGKRLWAWLEKATGV